MTDAVRVPDAKTCPECDESYDETGMDNIVLHVLRCHPGTPVWARIIDALNKGGGAVWLA